MSKKKIFPNGFKESKFNKFFKETFVGKAVSGLVRESLQSIPFVGTIVTSFKEDTKDNPKGKVNITKWDAYRLAIGLVLAYFMAKGILKPEDIEFLKSFIGI